MKKGLILIIFILSLSLVNASPLWFKYQNSLENNGVVDFVGPKDPVLKCKTEPLNHYLSSSSPVVDKDGTIYIGTFSKKLYAINPDCSVKWVFDDGTTSAEVSTPLIDDSGIIYFTNGNKLFAVNSDGSRKWMFQPLVSFGLAFTKSEPNLHKGLILIGGTYTTFAVNATTGLEKCRFTSEGSSFASGPSDMNSVSISNDNFYVADLNSLYKLDLNCNKIWKYELNQLYSRTPVILDNKIYISSAGKISVVNDNGQIDISFDIGSSTVVNDNIAVDENNIYVSTYNAKKLYVFSHGGLKRCEFVNDKWFESAPLVDSEGNIFVGSDDKNFYAIDNDCNLLWKYPTQGKITKSAAFGVNHSLIVPSEDKRVYIFKNKTEIQTEIQSNYDLPDEEDSQFVSDTQETDTDSTDIPKSTDIVTSSECNSCLIVGRRSGNNLVDSCNIDDLQPDVEACFVADYNCDTEDILDKKRCDDCQQGICLDESSDKSVDLDIPLIDVLEDDIVFDCDQYDCEGNIPEISTDEILESCTDDDKDNNYKLKGTVSSEDRNAEDSCLIMSRNGHFNFVNTCSGGFKDVESCYLVQYSCNDNKVSSKRTLCNLCDDGVCTEPLVEESKNFFSKILDWFKNLFN